MILTVTPNPTWDVTYRLPVLVAGAALRVREVTSQAGGKGVNVARTVRHLGGHAHVVAPVGGPTGQRLQEQLTDVPTTWVPIAAQTRTCVAVLPDRPGHDDAGHPTVLNEPGPPVTGAEWDLLTATVGGLAAHADAVVIAGSLPAGVDQEMWSDLIAVSLPAPTLVDTSGSPLLWAAQAGATVVKSNRSEAEQATGQVGVDDAAATLLQLGARHVVITDGARGLGYFTADSAVWAHCAAAVQGNPTGAGDAASAALAINYQRGPEAALSEAAAVAAASLLQELAGAVDPDDVARLRGHVTVAQVGC